MKEGCLASKRGVMGIEDENIGLGVIVEWIACERLGMGDISEVGEYLGTAEGCMEARSDFLCNEEVGIELGVTVGSLVFE